MVERLISVLAVVVLVVPADLVAMPILQQSIYRHVPATAVLGRDLGIGLAAGVAGLFVVSRLGSPWWWRSWDAAMTTRRAVLLVPLAALLLVAGNMVLLVVGRTGGNVVAPWLVSLAPAAAVALAFRAAIIENFLFRSFVFPLVSLLLLRFVSSKRVALGIGACASALLFGLVHPGPPVAFLAGLALVYIYHQRGLLPAMAAQFLGDAVPFLLLAA